MEKHTSGEDWNRDTMQHGRPSQARHIPSRQIEPGLFLVLNHERGSEAMEVGKVFVEGSGSVMIEHYVLSEDHASPTETRSMQIEHTDEEVDSLPAFFADMRERMAGRKVTYIKCTCEYADSIPEL